MPSYEELMNKYYHKIFKDRLTIYGPVDVKDFCFIKCYIKAYRLNIKNIIVE